MPNKPVKSLSVIDKENKSSKFGIGSKPSKETKAVESNIVICCCIKFSNQCSCSSGSAGTANMKKEEIEL